MGCKCTPGSRHAASAVAALKAGKYVVVKKPVAVTLRAIDHLMDVQSIHTIDLSQWLMGLDVESVHIRVS